MENRERVYSLLGQIAQSLSQEAEASLAKKIPAICVRAMRATACEVWNLDQEQWRFCEGYPDGGRKQVHSLTCANQWDRKTAIVFVNSDSHSLDGEGGCTYGLIPFWHGDMLCGCVKVVWDQDPLLPEEDVFGGLTLFSQILAKIYYFNPIIVKNKEREKLLLELYQDADQELETYRKRTALELHDEIGQVLTSVLLQIKLLQKSKDLAYIQNRLGCLYTITHEAMEEVRRISRDLRPYVLEKYGLRAAIEAHVEEFIKLTGIQVEFRCNNGERTLPESVENVLYRIMQEGLTNVARHSGSPKAVLTLAVKDNNVLLQILDYGCGITKEERRGLGLLGMEERVKLVGGRFWLVSDVGEGVSLNVLLSYHRDEEGKNGNRNLSGR